MAEFVNITPIPNTTVFSQNFNRDSQTFVYVGTLVLKANTGYYFDNNTTYQMYNGNASNPQYITGVINSTDNTKCSFSTNSNSSQFGNLNAPLRFNGNVVTTAINLTVTENLTDCTISGLPQTVTSATNLQLTITAANGYEFNTAPQLVFNDYIIDGDGNPINTVNFTVAQNKLTATLSFDLSLCDIASATGFTITAIAAAIAMPTVTITQTLQNCSVSGIPQTVYTNTVLNLTATAANGYEFNTAPNIYFLDGNGNPQNIIFTIAQNKLTATVTADLSTYDLDGGETLELTATAAVIPLPTVQITQDLDNCTISGLPQSVNIESVLNLTASANTGYIFETAPTLYGLDNLGNPFVFNFVLSSDSTTATVTADLSTINLNGGETLTIYASATAVTPYVDNYGTINVYKVTTENLAAFANVRFFKEKYNNSDTGDYFESIDLGEFVHSVKRLYVPITETTPETLKCGNYNTNIAVQTPLNDNLTIDCGTVAIPTHNLDNVDFQTEIQIFLPFVGFHSISSEYVGKVIALQYVCNLITANAVIQLICNDIIFDCIECNIGNDLIYKTTYKSEIKTAGAIDFNLQILKGLQPYAMIKYYNSENKQIINNDCLRGVLNSFVGYLQITELTNFANGNITENERTLLNSELENGCYIVATQ